MTRLGGAVGSLVAGLLVWFALVGPDAPSALSTASLVVVPLDGLVLLVVLLLLRGRVRRWVALLAGVALGAVALLRALDLAFRAALDRPFDPVTDWTYLRSVRDLARDSLGPVASVAVLPAAAALAVGLLVVLPWSVLRLSRMAARHRTASARLVSVLAGVWLAGAATALQLAAGAPLASAGAVGLATDHVELARSELQDRQAFAAMTAVDPFRDTPPASLLTGLRGKDVLVVFVESYGRVAVEGPPEVSGPVTTALASANSRLTAAGYSARSAWLTSPTFGGISWLAHSTLQSGLWVDSQRRYDELVAGERLTLAGAFHRAGWRTVADVPSNVRDWPQASSFYHYDTVYDARNVGYAGPQFGYAQVPDQYTLKTLLDRELAMPGHRPVMAEVDLDSSHLPWAPLPQLLAWDAVGDGSVYTAMRDRAVPKDEVWRSRAGVRAAYGQSVAYALGSLVAFAQAAHDDNLVMVVLGDHQPATVVSGTQADHDVPVTVISRDPQVMAGIEGWHWGDGVRPAHDAPVWRMDAFRDRFLTAFGPTSTEPQPDLSRPEG